MVLEAVTVVIQTNVVVVIVVAMATVMAMVTGGDAAAAPVMASEAEGSVRAMPDAPDAHVVWQRMDPDTVIYLLVCICKVKETYQFRNQRSF
jgi:hypothetical protein